MPFSKIIDGICNDPEYRNYQTVMTFCMCVWRGWHMTWGKVGFCTAVTLSFSYR